MKRRRRYKNSGGGSPPIALEKKTIKTILGIGVIGLALILLLSFFNQSGVLLSVRDPFYKYFGAGIIFIPALLVLISFPLLSLKNHFTKINVIFGAIGALFAFVGLVGVFSEEFSGEVGTILATTLASFVTTIGAFLILLLMTLVSLVIAANTSFNDAVATIVGFFRAVTGAFKAVKEKLTKKPQPKFATKANFLPAAYDLPVAKKIMPAQKLKDKDNTPGLSKSVVANQPIRGQIWSYPPLSLLSTAHGATANRGNINKNAEIIEKNP